MGGFDFSQLMQNPMFTGGLQLMLGNQQQQNMLPNMQRRQPNQNDLLRQLMASGIFGGLGKIGMVPGMGPGEGTGFNPNTGWS